MVVFCVSSLALAVGELKNSEQKDDCLRECRRNFADDEIWLGLYVSSLLLHRVLLAVSLCLIMTYGSI
jgi:hypothetical protein